MANNPFQDDRRPQLASYCHKWQAAVGAGANSFSSRLPGFYQLPLRERTRIVRHAGNLSAHESDCLENYQSISRELTDTFIENAIGTYSIPMGVATNFLINGCQYLIPMVVEETSVLAAASHGAKFVRQGGGFCSQSTEAIMTGQIQLLLTDEQFPFARVLQDNQQQLIDLANRGQERLVQRGGGVCSLDWKFIEQLKALIIHVHVDTKEAMGANIVNTICERLASHLLQLLPCRVGLKILTNLNDRRLVRAQCRIPASVFACPELLGDEVVERIVEAYQFADHDPYRATTNNKGIMNGIDPVVIATGNDWRAVEAGAHAYASRSGRYRPLAVWQRDNNYLCGQLELPLAVGTVGGVTKLHPAAHAALKILGQPSAQQLAEIIACVGLAQNLAALRALSTEGIQRGHMSLHRKNLHQHRRQSTVTDLTAL